MNIKNIIDVSRIHVKYLDNDLTSKANNGRNGKMCLIKLKLTDKNDLKAENNDIKYAFNGYVKIL